ncbi:MAG: Lrp/AsnC family transcriptional regulator [Sedimenticola sp.]
MQSIDKTDIRILRVLQSDGGLSVSEVADKVGLSQSPCSRRIIRMQNDGVILGRDIVLNQKALGFNLIIIVRIKLTGHGRKSIPNFVDQLKLIPEVQVIQMMMGGFDFQVRVMVKDMDDYQRLLSQQLVNLPELRELESTVVLEEILYTRKIPI